VTRPSESQAGPRRKALVTGAAGFIGSNVVRTLLEDGHEVRAFHLPDEDTSNLRGLTRDVECVGGDVTDRASLVRAMEGCDEVYHLAAVYALWTPDRGQRMLRVNVDGTRNVLEVARNSGVRRVVYTSSIARFGGQGMSVRATEQSPFALGRTGSSYATSKAVAHEIATSASKDLDIVIVAPCGPIGPGDIGPTPTGRLLLSALEMPFVVAARTMTNFVDVRDVARAHVLAAERGRRGETYLLGHRDLWMEDIARMALRARGLDKPILVAPFAAAEVGGRLASVIADRLTRRPPLFTAEAVRIARLGLRADCSKAVRELGMPQSSIEAAVADALAWFERQGMVRRLGGLAIAGRILRTRRV
jgi:dihydroflavonol-4-reductase